jgi:hypothetical protein
MVIDVLGIVIFGLGGRRFNVCEESVLLRRRCAKSAFKQNGLRNRLDEVPSRTSEKV